MKKEYLIEELGLPYEALEDDIIDAGRWNTVHEIIFQDKDGKCYRTWYSRGSTEMQWERPWEYEGDEIECTEVEQKEVKVLKWVDA